MASMKEMAESKTEKVISALIAIVDDDKAKDSDRIAAGRELLDRGHGKPVQMAITASFDGLKVIEELARKRLAGMKDISVDHKM